MNALAQAIEAVLPVARTLADTRFVPPDGTPVASELCVHVEAIRHALPPEMMQGIATLDTAALLLASGMMRVRHSGGPGTHTLIVQTCTVPTQAQLLWLTGAVCGRRAGLQVELGPPPRVKRGPGPWSKRWPVADLEVLVEIEQEVRKMRLSAGQARPLAEGEAGGGRHRDAG